MYQKAMLPINDLESEPPLGSSRSSKSLLNYIFITYLYYIDIQSNKTFNKIYQYLHCFISAHAFICIIIDSFISCQIIANFFYSKLFVIKYIFDFCTKKP